MHISLNMMCKIEHYQIIAQYVDEQIAAKAERVHINHILRNFHYTTFRSITVEICLCIRKINDR